MTRTLTDSLAYICNTIKKSFIHAFFLTAALIVYYAQNPLDSTVNQIMYSFFIGLSCVEIFVLYFTNRSKLFFSFLLGLMALLFLNWLKKINGGELIHCAQYIWLGFLLPLNFMFFYFLSPQNWKSNYGFFIFLLILMQMALIEHIDGLFLKLPDDLVLGKEILLWNIFVWLIFFSVLVIHMSIKNTLINIGLFYAELAFFLSFIYADDASAVAIFSLTFVVIIFGVTLVDIYSQYKYDVLDNVYSYDAYLSHTAGKFPFKYTVGVFSLDNREKILEQIGHKKTLILEQMLIDKLISEIPEDTKIYRYKENEFLMVFKNEDARHTYEYCDNIRRSVAASEFVLISKKSLKVTISICVSEKTRKYIDARVVAERGHNGLQKGGRFNNNIVTKAG